MARLTRAAPFVLISFALCVGIWLAHAFALPLWCIATVSILSLLGLILCARASQPTWAWVWALVLALALGAGRHTLAQPDLAHDSLRPHHGQFVVLEGLVADEPDVRPSYANLRLQPRRLAVDGAVIDLQSQAAPSGIHSAIDQIHIALQPPSRVLVKADKSQPWHYGDVIRAYGYIDAPPQFSDFSYRDYLARKGVLTWMSKPERVELLDVEQGNRFWAALYRVKDAVRQSSQRIMPAPESAFLNGILIGDDNEIPDDLQDAFRRTGTSHVVAISGFNVSIVIALIVPVLGRLFNKRRAAWVAMPAIVLYMLLVGASASVVRASVMALIALFGQILWRRGFTLNTLCAAAAFMLLADSNTLFDGGFQLSFMATLGLILYMDRIESHVRGWLARRLSSTWTQRLAGLLGDVLLGTLAAQITTLPLLLANFQQLSLISPLTNMLILPFQPMAMIVGGVAALSGIASSFIGTLIGWVAYVPLTITLRVVMWMSQASWASVPVYTFGDGAVLAYYTLLIGLTLFAAQPIYEREVFATAARKHIPAGTWMMGVVIVATLGGVYWFQQPDGQLHVVMSGSGAYIQTPGGRQFVFGGSTVIAPMGRSMPLWDRQVEWLFVPQAGDRTLEQALPILQRYSVQTLLIDAAYASPRAEPSPMRAEWDAALHTALHPALQDNSTAAPQLMRKPITLTLEAGLSMQVHPALEGGWVGTLHYGSTHIVLAGEAQPTRPSFSGDPANTLLFLAPRDADPRLLNAMSPRWIIWADTGGRPPNGLRRDLRTLSLKDIGAVEFVSNGRTWTLLP